MLGPARWGDVIDVVRTIVAGGEGGSTLVPELAPGTLCEVRAEGARAWQILCRTDCVAAAALDPATIGAYYEIRCGVGSAQARYTVSHVVPTSASPGLPTLLPQSWGQTIVTLPGDTISVAVGTWFDGEPGQVGASLRLRLAAIVAPYDTAEDPRR